MKIAINITWGGFDLSNLAIQRLNELGLNVDKWGISIPKIDRNDPRLIQVCEELGDSVSKCPGEIKVIEIPDDVKDWYISEYDGKEIICEGRQWFYTEETD